MSAFDLLKEVVDAMEADESLVWGEPRHASVGIIVEGRMKIQASVSSAERNGRAIHGPSISPFLAVPDPPMRMRCRPCDANCKKKSVG